MLSVARPVERIASRSIEEVFREGSSFVWRVLRHHGVPDRDLEDACQEVFVVVQRKQADLDASRGAISTWLYAIAWRVASAYRRSAGRRREVLGLDEEGAEPSAGPSPESALASSRQRSLLIALLEELDDDKRSVVILYDIEEMPMREVADALGCPLQTAYTRLHAGRKLLREALARGTKELR